MAEYSEVIKQFKRMCKSVTPMKCTRGECPMGCENIGQCRKVAFECPAKFEEQVMSWAAEHPVVYPTWWEYIYNEFTNSILLGTNKEYNTIIEFMKHTPIPADIAEKLELEPIK